MKKVVLFFAIAFMFGWCQAAPVAGNSCFDSYGVEVASGDTLPFYVPNAFTPNSDGINENFMLKYELTPEETFSVFFMMITDRHGNVMFKTYNPAAYWDGKDKNGALCPAGVYTYVIKYKLRRSTKAEEISKDALDVKTGNVVLIR